MTSGGEEAAKAPATIIDSVRDCGGGLVLCLPLPTPLASSPPLDHRVDDRALATVLPSVHLMPQAGGYMEVPPTASPGTLQPEAFLGERREGAAGPPPPSVSWGSPGARRLTALAPWQAVEDIICGSLEAPKCRNV